MFDILTTSQLFICFVIILTAYTVRGITGFGSGLIAIPLLVLMLPVSVVVPMIGLMDMSASMAHGVKLRSGIRWKQIFYLLPFSLLGVLLAMYLFNTVDPQLLKTLLGGFVFSYALYSLFITEAHTHSSNLWAVPGGVCGGLVGTLFGTGGPFYVIYLQLQGFSKAAFRATIAVIFLLDGSARIIAYTLNGFYSFDIMLLIAASLPVMIAAMYLGGHMHTNISQQSMQKGIAVLLLFSGGALMW